MSTYVWGVRIYMGDHMAPLAQETSIGLYNVNSVLTGNAVEGQAVVAVTDGTKFSAYTAVLIKEGATQEECFILSIDGNNLTMRSNLENSYTSAGSATVYADSEIRWLQNQIADVSNWNYSMIIQNGMDKIIRSVDLENGGNFASMNGFSVTVHNTSLLWNTLQSTLDVSLVGKLVQVLLFTNATISIQGTYICSGITWDKTQFTLQVRSAWVRRDANILTEKNVDTDGYFTSGVEEKTTTPATYGRWVDWYAQLNRTVNVDDKWSWSKMKQYFIAEGSASITSDNIDSNRNAWPIISSASSPSLTYTIQLSGSDESINISSMSDIIPTTLYIQIIEDDNVNGYYRRITNIARASANTLTLTLSDYFSTDPESSATGNGAWLSIVEIQRQYDFDDWPCEGFIDGDEVLINTEPEIKVYDKDTSIKTVDMATNSASGAGAHTHDIVPYVTEKTETEEDYINLPNYGFNVAVGDSDYNDVRIQPLVFKNNPDDVESFSIVPIENLTPLTSSNLDAWAITGDVFTLTGYNWKADGVYTNEDYITVSDVSYSNPEYTYDKNADTYSRFLATITYTGIGSRSIYPVFIFNFSIPDAPDGFVFDDLYLGVDVRVDFGGLTTNDVDAHIRYRKFIGEPVSIVDAASIKTSQIIYLKDMPDFYYTVNETPSNNYWFYVNHPVDEASSYVYGYENFNIPNYNTNKKYGIIKECAIIFQLDKIVDPGQSFTVTIDITQISAIFKRSANIKEKIFSSVRGRKYNNTWGGEVSSADMIWRGNNMYEHFCRLQNWRERDIMPSGGWGRAYSDNALIKTGLTAIGSLRHSDISDSHYPTRQFLDTSEGWISKIKSGLCREFFYAGYIDNNGYECIQKIPTTEGQLESPTELISYADIRLADSKITIEEPDPSRIYAEPFVRFNKNIATGEYESIVRVHNVTATGATGTPNYTGTTAGGWIESPAGMYSTAEATELWNKCVDNYELCNIINDPPSELTDLEWANGGDHAQEIAKDYLDNWVSWMRLKRVTFSVHFLTTAGGGTAVKDWCEGHRFRLQLVHETNNAVIECILSRISIDPNPPYHVEITAYMLEASRLPDDYYIVDTMDTNNPNWQDTMTVYGDNNDKQDNM